MWTWFGEDLKPDGRERSRVGRQLKKRVIMSTRLFVGNLSFNATQEQLQGLFGAHGSVITIEVIKDKFTNRPRGFGFVTMETQEAAEAAIQALNGKEIDGRALTVNVARPREERAPRADRGDRGDRGDRREPRA
jgi:RNA recognition motif-containing protein